MLPETGSISMSQVNVELQKGETTVITLNDTDVRKLAGINSGKISLNDLHGKRHGTYVSGYTIYSNSFTSNKSSSKNYSFSVQIPKFIINGEFTLSVTKSGRNSSGGTSSYATINQIGTTQYTMNTSNVKTKKTNFPKQTLNGSVSAGCGAYHSGNGDTRYNENTTSVSLKFTGEWEV